MSKILFKMGCSGLVLLAIAFLGIMLYGRLTNASLGYFKFGIFITGLFFGAGVISLVWKSRT